MKITRRQFLKKTGLVTAVALTGLINLNVKAEEPRRITCYAIEDYAIPESKQLKKENKTRRYVNLLKNAIEGDSYSITYLQKNFPNDMIIGGGINPIKISKLKYRRIF